MIAYAPISKAQALNFFHNEIDIYKYKVISHISGEGKYIKVTKIEQIIFSKGAFHQAASDTGDYCDECGKALNNDEIIFSAETVSEGTCYGVCQEDTADGYTCSNCGHFENFNI